MRCRGRDNFHFQRGHSPHSLRHWFTGTDLPAGISYLYATPIYTLLIREKNVKLLDWPCYLWGAADLCPDNFSWSVILVPVSRSDVWPSPSKVLTACRNVWPGPSERPSFFYRGLSTSYRHQGLQQLQCQDCGKQGSSQACTPLSLLFTYRLVYDRHCERTWMVTNYLPVLTIVLPHTHWLRPLGARAYCYILWLCVDCVCVRRLCPYLFATRRYLCHTSNIYGALSRRDGLCLMTLAYDRKCEKRKQNKWLPTTSTFVDHGFTTHPWTRATRCPCFLSVALPWLL